MLGFNPLDARIEKQSSKAKNKKNPQHKSGGGLITGAGSGTSDDIKAKMPAGSYIMPADSTKQIGPEVLSDIGHPMDVRVSNGEYQMPPEQVHALGAQVLDQIKNQTHTPADRGFQSDVNRNGEQFFSQGGLIEGPDELRRRLAPANRPALPAPEARPALPPPQAQPSVAQPQASTAQSATRLGASAQNTAFNSHGRGDYTAADQTRARARADGAVWDAERAKQDAKFRAASAAQPQVKQSGLVSRGRDAVNKGGRFAPFLALADTAATGFQTPTEKYRERFALETDEPSFWGDVGVRALGLASDLGNTLTFGQAGRLYRDKQREDSEGGDPYMEKAPQAAAVAGGYVGSKAGAKAGRGMDKALNITGKTIDKGLQLVTRGKYKKDYAEKGLSKLNGEKTLALGAGAGGGYGGYKVADDLINTPTKPEAQTPAPVEQQQIEQRQEQTSQQPSTASKTFQPSIVDGVPTFTNEHAKQFDPGRINTIPSSAMKAPSGQTGEALSAALRDAAARGDWGAVQNHYNSQGKPFGSAGFDSGRSRGMQVNVVRDTSRAPTNAEMLHQRMEAGRQSRDLDERKLGFDIQQAQARQDLLERNQSMQETLSMPQLRSAQQLENLYQMHERAQTEEERRSIAEQISQLQSSSRSQRDNYITLGGGQVWDENAQSMVNQPQQLFDIANQQIVSAGQQLPPLAQNPQAQAILADVKKSREQKALELRQMGYSIDLSKFQ